MNNNKDVDMYVEVLTGGRSRGQYKQSNLFIIDKTPQTVIERAKHDISPPTNLNADYYEPIKRKSKAGKSHPLQVDSDYLKRFLK